MTWWVSQPLGHTNTLSLLSFFAHTYRQTEMSVHPSPPSLFNTVPVGWWCVCVYVCTLSLIFCSEEEEWSCLSVWGTVVRFLSSLSLLSWPFLGVFESVSMCVCVCVRGYFAHNALCWGIMRGLADRNRSLLVVWLAVRGFLCLEMKKRGQEAKQTRKEKWRETLTCCRLVNYFLLHQTLEMLYISKTFC